MTVHDKITINHKQSVLIPKNTTKVWKIRSVILVNGDLVATLIKLDAANDENEDEKAQDVWILIENLNFYYVKDVHSLITQSKYVQMCFYEDSDI